MNKNETKKRFQKGMSSIELIVYLSIATIMIMSCLAAGSILVRDTRIKNTISDMQLIAVKVNEMFANESSFEGLTDEIFIKSGNAPNSIINSTRDGLRSSWGSMTLEPATSSTDNDVFTLTLSNIPLEVCLKLGNIIKNADTWAKLEVGSSAYDAITDQDNSMITFLSEACKKGSNTMIFTSKRQ